MDRIVDEALGELMEGIYSDPGLFQNIFVPERYAVRVVSHVAAHYLSNNHYFMPPLYLAIHGAPGEGKTMQALAACTRYGIMVRYLSASQLSGGYEGDSRAVIEEAYRQCEKLQRLGKYVCLLLDDFHLGNAALGNEASRTVNAELLVGYMMNLAEAAQRNRVPVLLTGNDFSGVYEALLRDGRADLYEWIPTDEEKAEIARHLLHELVIKRDLGNLDKFIMQKIREGHNVAFFSQLRGDLRREILTDALRDCKIINPRTIQDMERRIQREFLQVDTAHLERLANQRHRERRNGGVEHGAGKQ